jgi:hypothetical protein
MLQKLHLAALSLNISDRYNETALVSSCTCDVHWTFETMARRNIAKARESRTRSLSVCRAPPPPSQQQRQHKATYVSLSYVIQQQYMPLKINCYKGINTIHKVNSCSSNRVFLFRFLIPRK